MAAEKFARIYTRAAKRKGSDNALEAKVGQPLLRHLSKVEQRIIKLERSFPAEIRLEGVSQ